MKNNASFMGVRVSFLLDSICNLGKQYPPALEALKARRDEAQKKMSVTQTDFSALRDFADLNHYLGDDQVTLSYFEKLPPKSRERAAIGEYIFDLLLTTQRYSDAISAQPYDHFKDTFKRLHDSLGSSPAEEDDGMREFIVTDAAKEIEALAGANQMDDARNLLKTILNFDHSAIRALRR
jgi:hypothetical protein